MASNFDDNSITFGEVNLQGESLNNPTALAFSKTGNPTLFVTQETAQILRYEIASQADNGDGDTLPQYVVTNTVTINDINSDTQNYNDDGSTNATFERQMTGIETTTDANGNDVLYVSSSDTRISVGVDSGLDTNSGQIHKLVLDPDTGAVISNVAILRGLPRSEENHSTNGLDLHVDPNTGHTILWIAQGGNTNKGAPGNNFAGTVDFVYSGTILKVDLDVLESYDVRTDGNGNEFILDLPTLDDPSRPNVNLGTLNIQGPIPENFTLDANGNAPDWAGGNNGLNQAKVAEKVLVSDNGQLQFVDTPLTIHAPGYRNNYDVLVTETGEVYTWDNGPNGGWGGQPLSWQNNTIVNDWTTQLATNQFNEGGSSGFGDQLHYAGDVTDAFGPYGGDANPLRAAKAVLEAAFNTDGSYKPANSTDPVFDEDGVTQIFANESEARDYLAKLLIIYAEVGGNWKDVTDDTGLPPDLFDIVSGYNWEHPGSSISNPQNHFSGTPLTDGTYFSPESQLLPQASDGSLRTTGDSTNGLAEYTGTFFGGALKGVIVAAGYGGGLYFSKPMDTNGDGRTDAVDDIGTISGFGSNPLGLATIGDGGFSGTFFDVDNNGVDDFAGLVVAATRGSDNVTFFLPGGTPADPGDDLDLDGLNNVNDSHVGDPAEGKGVTVDANGSELWHFELNNPATTPPGAVAPGESIAGDIGINAVWRNGVDKQVGALGEAALYDPDQWNLGGASSFVSIDAADGGSAVGAANDQGDVLGIGFQAQSGIDSVTITTEMINIFDYALNQDAPAKSWDGGEKAGLMVGPGHQSTYAEGTITAVNDNGTIKYGLQLLVEENDSPNTLFVEMPNLGTAENGITDGTAQLALVLDMTPGSETVKAQARFLDNGTYGQWFETGEIAVPDAVVQAVKGQYSNNGKQTGAVVGLVSSKPGDADDGFAASWDWVQIDGGDAIGGLALYRVNAGGGLVQATDGGPDWAANTGSGAQSGAGFSNNTGNTATFNNPVGRDASLPTYVPDDVFFTERWDSGSDPEMHYSFDVTPGQTYGVNIFARNGYSGTNDPGERVFDIEIEGQEIFSDVDLSAAYGHLTGGMLQHVVTVQDNSLDIEWIHQTENPTVNAIEIVQIGGGGSAPADSVNGVPASGGDFSEDRLNPTSVAFADGTTRIVATQEGDPNRDYDYIHFTVAAGTQLTAINVVGFNDYDPSSTNSVFLGLQAGTTFTEDPANPNAANLLGGAVFGEIEIGDNLLPDMADGVVEGYGNTQGFTAPLAAGDYTLWFSQNQAATTSTLDFVVQGGANGAATLAINENSNNVQTSNFGVNAFKINNVGDKNIASVEIDVTNALYADSVFDPFGNAGDTTAKDLEINTDGGTGVEAPNNDENDPNNETYIGAGGIDGYEGIKLFFNDAVNGGFESGETVGFSVDMDPNSIAGAAKGTLDSGADPTWDIGGISGAELIGSTFTVTFTDGSTATGQLQGKGNQAGSKGLATQDSPNTDVTLTVNGLAEGGVGTYDANGPSVIINGPAGATARVVLTKGIIQPVSNNFTEPYASQLDAQLDALRAEDFPANNAAEFQTFDVPLTGVDQDITNLFDFTQVPGFELAVDEAQVPLGFVAGIIDPNNDNLPLGPVSAPIYMTFTSQTEPTISLASGPTTVESGDAGNTTLSFALTATQSLTGTVDLNFKLDGVDQSATVNFVNGAATLVQVPVANDDDANGDDVVTISDLVVTSPANVSVDPNANSATGTITEDDFAPVGGDDTVSGVANQANTLLAADLLSNDTDGDNSTAQLTIVGAGTNGANGQTAQGGTVSVAANGDVTYTPAGGFTGNDTFIYTVEDPGGNQGTAQVTVGIPVDGGVIYRVNAGGDLVQATDGGPDWAANAGSGAQSGAGFSNNIGNVAGFSSPVGRDASLPAYVPDGVLFDERWDSGSAPEMQYSFDVTPGQTYGVNIIARNGYSGTSEPGQRVFDIKIEGQEVFSDIDLSGTYGHLTGGMLQHVLTVQDNSLDIEWVHQTENPLVNGIEIVQIGSGTGESVVSIGDPAPSTVQESGDNGTTTVVFPVTFDTPPASVVTVEYSVDINGVVTTGLTQALGTSDGSISVDVPNDDVDDGPEAVFVTLTGLTVGDDVANLGTTQASATVTEDDTPAGNVAPVITSDGGGATASVNVAENTIAVTNLSATDDSDSEGSGLTYSKTGGADADKFNLNAVTGELTFINAPDYENPADAGGDNGYNVTVTVTDSGGLSDSQDITVTVTDVDEGSSPDAEIVLINADTDVPVGSVGTIEEGELIPLSLIDGLNLSMEAIVPAGSPYDGQVESVVFNFDSGQKTQTESVEPYALFGDSGGDFAPGLEDLLSVGDHVITVALHAQNGGSGTPLATISRNFTVIDDSGGNVDPIANNDGGAGFITDEDTAFTMANVLTNDSDPDTGDILSVQSINTAGAVGQVINNGDGTFNYNPNGQFEGLDTGETATDSFVYTVTDGNGGTDTATVTVTINGVDDPSNNVAPVITGGATASVDVAENQTTAIDVNATDDSDSEGSGLTYSKTGGADADKFNLNAVTGELTFINAPDYENPADAGGDNGYNVTVTVTDSGGLTDSQDITVNVSDVNEGDCGVTLIGNSGANTLIGSDCDDTITAKGGADTINGGAGVDTIHAGGGGDVIEVSGNEAEFDDVTGGGGYDKVVNIGTDDLLFDMFNPTGGLEELDANGQVVFGNANANILNFNKVVMTAAQEVSGLAGEDAITASTKTHDVMYDGGADDDLLTGKGKRDKLLGGEGNDTIAGAGGSDTINGGTDDDDLTGGGGKDLFEFTGPAFGNDTVFDFDDAGNDVAAFISTTLTFADFDSSGDNKIDVNDVGANVTFSGGDLTLIFDAANSVTFDETADLTKSDLIFS